MTRDRTKKLVYVIMGLTLMFSVISTVNATVGTGEETGYGWWLVHDANSMGSTGDDSGAEGGVAHALLTTDTDYIWVRESYPYRGTNYLSASGLEDPNLPIEAFGYTRYLSSVDVCVSTMIETNIGIMDNTGDLYAKITTHNNVATDWISLHAGDFDVARDTTLYIIGLADGNPVWNAIEGGDYVTKIELKLSASEEWGTRVYMNIDDFYVTYYVGYIPQH